MSDISVCIIGAGVVGLAIANKLSSYFNDVFVIERHTKYGQETSSRNSEVIHAGIYYPSNTLKAKLCVEGKNKLYDFCEKHEIEYKKCGKYIVATNNDEIEQLNQLYKKAIANGVNDLQLLSKQQVNKKEPSINVEKALFSPSTGIINASGLMQKLETISVNKGVEFVYKSKLKNISYHNNEYKITIIDSEDKIYSFTSKIVINSAGLESDKIATMLGITEEYLRIQFCKGEYFRVNPPKNRMVKSLIYPVPFKKLVGAGIHATIDISGNLKLGPDAEYLKNNEYNYKVTLNKQNKFYKAVKTFIPFIEYDDLAPEMVGIRPKIQKKGEDFKDFYIKNEKERGYPNFINLIGIESPGLTSCLSIAEYVYRIINK